MTSVNSELTDLSNRAAEIISERTLDEANTRNIIIEPLLEQLGWSVDNPSQVLTEYPVESAPIPSKADYALLDRNGSPQVVIEVKAPTVPINHACQQVREYMRLFGADFGLATNGADFTLFAAVGDYNSPDERTVFQTKVEDIDGDSFEQIRAGRYWNGEKPAYYSGEMERSDYPRDVSAGSDHLKCVYTLLKEAGKLSPADVYERYQKEMGERAYSNRMVRDYLKQLEDSGYVAREGPKTDRVITFLGE